MSVKVHIRLAFFFWLTAPFSPFSRDRLCVFPRFSLLALRLSIRAAVVSLPRERMNGVSGPSAGKGGRHFFILKRQLFFFEYVGTIATREFMSPCYALFHETHDWFIRFSVFSSLLFLVWTVFIVHKLQMLFNLTVWWGVSRHKKKGTRKASVCALLSKRHYHFFI